MKRNFLFASLLILFANSALAQNFVQGGTQSIAQQANFTLPFAKPNSAPCTLFMVTRGDFPTIADSQGDMWTATGQLWTAPCSSGANSISAKASQQFYFQAAYGEWVGTLVPDGFPSCASGTGTQMTSPSISSTAGDLILSYGWNDTSSYYTVSASGGFTMRESGGSQYGQGVNVYLEDEIAAGGLVSASPVLSAAGSWTACIAAFKPAGPPPPLTTLPFKFTLPGSGGGQGFTVSVDGGTAIPSCQLSDGNCSLTLTITDCNGNAVTALTPGCAVTLSIFKVWNLPVQQNQTTILANVTSP